MSNELSGIDLWENKNILKVRGDRVPKIIEECNPDKLRTEIEPWLTALFQSEHLSLLLGAGISSATHLLSTGNIGAGMSIIDFSVFKEQIEKNSKESAKLTGRVTANIEDQIRVTNELIKGIEILTSIEDENFKIIKENINVLEKELRIGINTFANQILECERNIITSRNFEASEYLMNFLMSFASRTATRERLNIFTINYDRIIEFGAELAGIRLIDRFVGSISPIFRSSRLEVDMHYNPPGIRGEPRYLEGVVFYTKLHGSLDWIYENGYVRRISLPYGANDVKPYLGDSRVMMIYPNASKDRETSEYPYVELFRDFAAAVCYPNSTMVLYGYSFGDEHINRIIEDMLTIPSTHLVIISFDDASGRVKEFYEKLKRPAQITLLIGNHFGDLKILVDNYLPKPAIDKATFRMIELLKARGWDTVSKENKNISETGENGL